VNSPSRFVDRLLLSPPIRETLAEIDLQERLAQAAAGEDPQFIRNPSHFDAALRNANRLHRKLRGLVGMFSQYEE